jgi:hypothetical protein
MAEDQNSVKSPRKKRKVLLIIVGALVGLLFLCILVAILTSGDSDRQQAANRSTPAAAVERATAIPQSTRTPVPTNMPRPTRTPSPTATITKPVDTPQPLYLGDVVEQYSYLLSAITVEDPTTPGMFYQAREGYKLVAVEIIVGNVSGETLSVNPLYATLVDNEGFVYHPELAGREGQILTVNLSPGEKARGWVAFEVPEGATVAGIKYAVDPFGGKVLQTSLIPPPEGYTPITKALSILPPLPEARFGDVAEQYGYSLSAANVEDPTTPGMFYQAREGYKLVAVEIIVGNISGETLSVNPLYAVLVDSNGFVYQPELAGRDGQLATTDLNDGERAKGWVAFEIPEDTSPVIIKYLVEVFSDNWMQVGLTE